MQYINISNLNTLISNKLINYIIITTPNYLHKKPIIKTTKNKKHVFYKKPITLNYKNYINIIKTYKKTNITFMAKHIINFFNKIQYTQKLIKKNIINKILSYHTKKNN